MSRSQRIQIVIGICIFLIGGVAAVVGPALVGFLLTPRISMADPDFLNTQMAGINRAAEIAKYLFLGGLAVASLGLLYVFVVWARWFVGEKER